MKKELTCSILLAIIIHCGAIPSFAQKIIELKTLTKENIKKNKINVFIETDSLQEQPETGLRFSVILKNYSDSAITIYNPAEMLRPRLVNDAGTDIIYPHLSRSFICARMPFDYFYTSFDIEKITIDDAEINTDLTSISHITIPGKTGYKIFFKIRKILPPGTAKPYNYAATIKIPAGRYSFSLHMAIAAGQQMDFYTMEPLSIDYCALATSEQVIIRNYDWERRDREKRSANRVFTSLRHSPHSDGYREERE